MTVAAGAGPSSTASILGEKHRIRIDAGVFGHDEVVEGDAPVIELFHQIAQRDSGTVSRLLEANRQLFTARSQSAEEFLAEIQHQFYAGDTALHIAAAAFWSSLTLQLLDGGASASAANRRGAQPLHYAVDGIPGSPLWDPTAQVEVIATLLRSGADPNAQDKNGTTPLHRAVRNRCSAAVGRLLEAGADPDVRNRRGSTARQLAQRSTGRGGSGLSAAKREQEKIVAMLER